MRFHFHDWFYPMRVENARRCKKCPVWQRWMLYRYRDQTRLGWRWQTT